MTWFRVGGAGIPAALKNAMNAVFNKKFGTSGQNYPPNQWPDEVNLMGPLPEGTASGPIANISDGADQVPIKLWNSNVDASVDGVSSVDCTKSGKNLVNGYIDYNSTNKIVEPVFLKAGNYTISFQRDVGVSAIYIRKGDTIILVGDAYLFKYNTTFFAFNADVDGYYYFQFYRSAASTTWEDAPITNVQLEVGSTVTAFEAYTAPTQYTVSLGRTIHGGSLEFINGAGTDENDVNFTFDPISPIPETENVCNFWTNVGASSVVYRRDIELALQALSGNRGLMMSSRSAEPMIGEESDPDQVNELVENDEEVLPEQLNEIVENDEKEQEGENDAR